MAAPLIGLAARAIAGLVGKKAAKQYARGSGSRKADSYERLKETGRGIRQLKEDMQKDLVETKKRYTEKTAEANKVAQKLATTPRASYTSASKTKQ